MLPPQLADDLNKLGHDAIAVVRVGLASAPDESVYATALEEHRIMVTEDIADYAAILTQRLANDEPCVPVVAIHKPQYLHRGALAHRLADRLHRWAGDNPDPYPGLHWP